jgi:hypothetical protein
MRLVTFTHDEHPGIGIRDGDEVKIAIESIGEIQASVVSERKGRAKI